MNDAFYYGTTFCLEMHILLSYWDISEHSFHRNLKLFFLISPLSQQDLGQDLERNTEIKFPKNRSNTWKRSLKRHKTHQGLTSKRPDTQTARELCLDWWKSFIAAYNATKMVTTQTSTFSTIVTDKMRFLSWRPKKKKWCWLLTGRKKRKCAPINDAKFCVALWHCNLSAGEPEM